MTISMSPLKPMLYSKSFHLIIKVLNKLVFALPILLLMSCVQSRSDDTARSGKMNLALDRQLLTVAKSQVTMFHGYYPDAHISLLPVSSDTTLRLLLDHHARAALIEGRADAHEDSSQKNPLRRELVARDAIVCIVNSRNPLKSISLKDLCNLYTRKNKAGMIPLVTANDFHLQSLFSAITDSQQGDLKAWACQSDSALLRRLSVDKRAVGLLFNSSPELKMVMAKSKKNIRMLPLSKDARGPLSLLPTQQNIFDGSYPLVTTVYYVYYSGDPLAAGFGSWLSGAGQKAFERSTLAPCKLVERTLILN